MWRQKDSIMDNIYNNKYAYIFKQSGGQRASIVNKVFPLHAPNVQSLILPLLPQAPLGVNPST